MSEEYRHFEIRAKFKLVDWQDLKEGDRFWYFIRRHKPQDQMACGPFTMVDTETTRLRNPQGVEIPFFKLKPTLQPMILVETDNDTE